MTYLEKVISGINKRKSRKQHVYIQLNREYVIRTEMHQGKQYIVAPVIMMVEGVHNGSHGPLLHLAEDLGRFPESWNGIPVVIQHPEDDGGNVSANSPSIIDREIVGRVYNTKMDGLKLKAEVWLDLERLNQISPDALEYIRLQKPLQVSIGVFTEEENKSGKYAGVEYESIARNHRPDHLALLPGGEGACSWTDGCGIRLNKQTKKKGEENVNKKENDLSKVVNNITSAGLEALQVTDNETGYRELTASVQAKLDGMDDGSKTHYLVEMYDNRVIYRINSRNEEVKYYQRGYSINQDGEVLFADNVVEVRRNVSYTTLEAKRMKRTKFSNNKMKGDKMSEEKCPSCVEKVDLLVANELTKFTDKDKEWLLTMKEDDLDKLVPNEPKKEEKVPVEVNKDTAIKVLKETLKTPEDFFAVLPGEMRDQMKAALSLHAAQNATMVKEILANTEDGVWTGASLKALNAETLGKVFNSVKKESPVDYSLNFAGKTPVENEEILMHRAVPEKKVKEGKEEK